MKNSLYIALVCLLSAFAVSCDDHEMDDFTGPYRINLAGPEHVAPGDVEVYTIGDINNPDTYSWTIEGPAQITSSANGAAVTVEFTSVGEVVLNVSNGRDTREYHITVEDVAPDVTTQYNGTGVLRSGQTDTVFFSFAAPLEQDPNLLQNEDISEFMSGTLGELIKIDAQNYYALYTAGEGNGIPEAMFESIIGSSTFGSDTLDSVMVQLYRVDNVAPVANVSFSEQVVSDSAVVTVTVAFSEPVTFQDPEDSTLYVTFSGAGVEEERAALVQSADDPLVYTYDYTVNGEGNGTVEVDFENVTDLAGHPISAINYDSELRVDNTGPVVIGTVTTSPSAATLRISSSESGTAMYVIMESGADAPEDVEGFMAAEGIASGALDLNAAVPKTVNLPLAAGDYVAYFLSQDMAGNYSAIQSVGFSVE